MTAAPAKAGFIGNQSEDVGEECARLRKQVEHYQRKEEEQRDKFHNLRMENMLTKWMSNVENKLTSTLMNPGRRPQANGYEQRRFDYGRQRSVTFNTRPRFEYEQRRNNDYRRSTSFNNRPTNNHSRDFIPNYASRGNDDNWKPSAAQSNGRRYVNPLVSSDRKNYDTKN